MTTAPRCCDAQCGPALHALYSIVAHSLYEESHPQLQFYPEGILVMGKTEFFTRDSRATGIRNSKFIRSSKP